MMARALDAHSIIGKDLDSLADDVSFGVAPSLDCILLFKEMHYPGAMESLAALYTLSRISYFRILCTAAWPSSTTTPARQLFRRTSRPGKRLVLGFIGDGRSRLAGEQQFPSGLSVAAGLPFLMAAGIGDTNVLTEIQESVMERQQNKLHFPDCLHSVPHFLGIAAFLQSSYGTYCFHFLQGKVNKQIFGTVVVLKFA